MLTLFDLLYYNIESKIILNSYYLLGLWEVYQLQFVKTAICFSLQHELIMHRYNCILYYDKIIT